MNTKIHVYLLRLLYIAKRSDSLKLNIDSNLGNCCLYVALPYAGNRLHYLLVRVIFRVLRRIIIISH